MNNRHVRGITPPATRFGVHALALLAGIGAATAQPRDATAGTGLTLYPDLAAFLAATDGIGFAFEDFSEGNSSSTSPCFEPVKSGFGAPATTFLAPTCFAPGDIVDGFAVRTNTGWNPGPGGGGSDWGPAGGPGMFFAGSSSGNGGVSNVVGAFSGTASTTLVDFADQPTAIAMDVYDVLAGSPLTVEVYAAGGALVQSFMLFPGDPHLPSFAGFTSPVPVMQVAVRSASGASQMVGNLRFGGGPGKLVVDTGAELAFGSHAVGSSTQRDLVLRNDGHLDVQVGTLEPPLAPFALAGDACSGALLAPDASCIVAISFVPAIEHRFAASLAISSDAPDPPGQVRLSGHGVVPTLTSLPDAIDFGVVAVGGTSPPAFVTLANVTAVPLGITAIGTIAAPFSAAGGDCGAVPLELAPGETCTLGFTFAPTQDGVFDSRVRVESDDPGGPAYLQLRGTTGDVIFADGFESGD
jgi:hypothetical protein